MESYQRRFNSFIKREKREKKNTKNGMKAVIFSLALITVIQG